MIEIKDDSEQMHMEIITSDEFVEKLRTTLSVLHAHCGIIFNIDEQNKAVNKGTVTFVKINGIEGLITNHHVYEVLKLKSEAVLVHDSIEYKIALPDLEIYSDEKELDYAWLPLNKLGNFNSKAVLFFDSTVFRNVVEQLYEEYGKLSPEHAAKHIGVLVMNGTPNYGNFDDEGTGTQYLFLTPMQPSMRRFELCNFSNKASQITFQFDVNKYSIADVELQKVLGTKPQSDKDGAAFGGYSGGPICAMGTDGYYLIGIIKQCQKFDSLYAVLASPITAIYDDILDKSFK